MNINWRPVDSERITHEAYDAEAEIVLVRFTDGIEWCYEACPVEVWEAFTRPSQSRGQYIRDVLNLKPHHRHAG